MVAVDNLVFWPIYVVTDSLTGDIVHHSLDTDSLRPSPVGCRLSAAVYNSRKVEDDGIARVA